MRYLVVALLLSGCTTTYVEVKGECVIQQWSFLGGIMRKRTICDLPVPEANETPVRDREAMDTNPFPDLIDLDNNADSMDPDLLEKNMGVPPDEDDQ